VKPVLGAAAAIFSARTEGISSGARDSSAGRVDGPAYGGEPGEDGRGRRVVGHGDVPEGHLGEAVADLRVAGAQRLLGQPPGLPLGLGDPAAHQLLPHVLEDVLAADPLLGELTEDRLRVLVAEQLVDPRPHLGVADLEVVALRGHGDDLLLHQEAEDAPGELVLLPLGIGRQVRVLQPVLDGGLQFVDADPGIAHVGGDVGRGPAGGQP
jgi:hypothetical protein